MVKESVKNSEGTELENKIESEGKMPETAEKVKPGRKAKPKEDNTPTFTDEEVAEFKAWKASRRKALEVKCDAPEDDKIYRKWKEESRLVKGVFRCREPEGGNVTFAFKKYKWDKTKWYTLYDGETYEIPLAVARHLNQNCGYEVHSHILGADGLPTVNRNKTKSRMNFESTEFIFTE